MSLASEIARRAAELRWDRVKDAQEAIDIDWHETPIEDCKEHLERILAVYQEGARIVQQRLGTNSAKTETCHECKKTGLKKWAYSQTMKDPKTQLDYNIFLCSAGCHLTFSNRRRGGIIK